MLKLIREEKTFELNMKNDLQEALQNIYTGQSEVQDKKNELEEQWLTELIQRKKQEVQEMKEQAENKEIKNCFKEDERKLPENSIKKEIKEKKEQEEVKEHGKNKVSQ